MTQEASRRQSSRQKPAIERSLAYASPQVQSGLPAKRDGPRAPQIRPRKSKLIQINPRKIAWISLDLFGGIGAFQWVTANPNKKNSSPVTLDPRCHKSRKLGWGASFDWPRPPFDDQ